jgi:hypothetical protein
LKGVKEREEKEGRDIDGDEILPIFLQLEKL